MAKVAYHSGIVISTCKECRKTHLIADHENKLDFPRQYGTKVEEFLIDRGEKVQKLTIAEEDLEKYYLVDIEGEIRLIPKQTGEVR